jgi:hypothetical protein
MCGCTNIQQQQQQQQQQQGMVAWPLHCGDLA